MLTTSGASDAYTRIYCDWTGSHPLLSTTLYKELPTNGMQDGASFNPHPMLTYHSGPNISRIPIGSLHSTCIKQQSVSFGLYRISNIESYQRGKSVFWRRRLEKHGYNRG